MSHQQPAVRSRPVTVELASLVLDGSPRLGGEDEDHIRLLAQATDELPPILVHRQTMRVLDGMHRVQAAKLRGHVSIRAVFFDGDADAAFVQAVTANVAHGLPLTLADRKAAATRILKSHPGWSDRVIASAAGLSPMTVRSLRRRATDSSIQSHTRLGRDGRIRPLDASEGRRRAAALLADQPDASLREVARSAGVSVATVRDVRRRLHNGQAPVPDRRRATRGIPGCEPATGNEPEPKHGLRGTTPAHQIRRPDDVLAGLLQDPSLRYSDNGRTMLRWLSGHLVSSSEWSQVGDLIPPHCALAIAEFAAGCARAWTAIAEDLMAGPRQLGSVDNAGYEPFTARSVPLSADSAVTRSGGG